MVVPLQSSCYYGNTPISVPGSRAVAYIMEIIPRLRLEIISLYMPMRVHPKTEDGVLPLVATTSIMGGARIVSALTPQMPV